VKAAIAHGMARHAAAVTAVRPVVKAAIARGMARHAAVKAVRPGVKAAIARGMARHAAVKAVRPGVRAGAPAAAPEPNVVHHPAAAVTNGLIAATSRKAATVRRGAPNAKTRKSSRNVLVRVL